MAGNVEGEKRLHRVTREEMYGTVGQPVHSLRDALKSSLPQWIVEACMRGAEDAGVRVLGLEFKEEGPLSRVLKLRLERGAGSGVLKATFEGDWSKDAQVPGGLPVKAGYEGKFFRFLRPGEPCPIAEVNDELKPGDPYGLAMVGKSNLWLLRVDPKAFPNGGRITAFDPVNGVNGAEVKQGATLLYIKPL